MTVAHQDLSQLTPRMLGALSNVQTKVIFGIGRADAEYFARLVGRVDTQAVKRAPKTETQHEVFAPLAEQWEVGSTGCASSRRAARRCRGSTGRRRRCGRRRSRRTRRAMKRSRALRREVGSARHPIRRGGAQRAYGAACRRCCMGWQ
ncbi:MAG: hypothetical protein M5R40_17035 [Anaerolineae bacterium]|nr:hypothetical protein [Anaerolineae bacterium]